jgi:hypothetical protein
MTWLAVAFSWVMASLILAPVLGHFLSMVEEHTDFENIPATERSVAPPTNRAAPSSPEPRRTEQARSIA